MSDTKEARADELLERLLEEGIKPHTDAILAAHEAGGVAVVLFEPVEEHEPMFRAMGWPDRPAFPMTPQLRRSLLDSDPVTRRWLEVPRDGVVRIFALVHRGSLLVNYDPERGYWIEPNSLDGPTC